MSCGMITFTELGLADKIERYVAYEYDVKSVGKKGAGEFGFPALVASHNFPNIEQRGDIYKADFTEFIGFDYILAGFPCTKFSIAQKKDRETKPYSGEGWDLFEKAWRAVQEVEPKFFLFENNWSMAKEVRDEISKIIGFDPIMINSDLLSAQTRKRIYWLGRRNSDGTYSQIYVEQPKDRGIILEDVLEYGVVDREKSYCLKHQSGNARDYIKKHHTQVKFIPISSPQDKSFEVRKGFITYKDKAYKINLDDGFYIIEKLSVLEHMRLQTVPEWYDFSPVSETHAYTMLGNGWTVEVIKYLISHTLE